jgi:hypothetical protein
MRLRTIKQVLATDSFRLLDVSWGPDCRSRFSFPTSASSESGRLAANPVHVGYRPACVEKGRLEVVGSQ